ncbi:unnamed protein product [Cuscuta campestris]|uniref:Uncharacterized protein n=1 Tax=Cuscuta campestris TaxID=132261 RepID=A0A484MIP3_9ASTE|nr:unnamed protein product [Cuscuta campestris]
MGAVRVVGLAVRAPRPAVWVSWWGCPGRLTGLFGPAVRGCPIGAAGWVFRVGPAGCRADLVVIGTVPASAAGLRINL